MEMVDHYVSVLVIKKEEEREERTCPFFFRHSHRICTRHLCHWLEFGLHGHTYVAIREAGKCSLWLDSHVPS